jgi:uncharacterized membrane protein YdbT with pleckstrin-like domain
LTDPNIYIIAIIGYNVKAKFEHKYGKPKTLNNSNELVCEVSPSQVYYIFRYCAYLVAIYIAMFELTSLLASINIDLAITFHRNRDYLALLIIIKAIYDFLTLMFILYRIENSQLTIRTGVFSRTTEKIELFRIKDITVKKTFVNRLFGLGNIHVISSDETSPSTTLVSIVRSDHLADVLNAGTRLARRENGVREID